MVFGVLSVEGLSWMCVIVLNVFISLSEVRCMLLVWMGLKLKFGMGVCRWLLLMNSGN